MIQPWTSVDGGRAVHACARVVDVLSDPVHAEIIRTELGLASQAFYDEVDDDDTKNANTAKNNNINITDADANAAAAADRATYYKNRGYPSQLRVLERGPDEPRWGGRGVNDAARTTHRKRPLYPFLAHALHHAVAVDGNNNEDPFFVSEDPGLVIHADDYRYATVFLDVTDPATIRYGFLVRAPIMVWNQDCQKYEAPPIARAALSAQGYMDAPALSTSEPCARAALARLATVPVIDPDHMPRRFFSSSLLSGICFLSSVICHLPSVALLTSVQSSNGIPPPLSLARAPRACARGGARSRACILTSATSAPSARHHWCHCVRLGRRRPRKSSR